MLVLTTTPDTRADFSAFARAALKIVPHLIDAIPDRGRNAINGGLRGGASIVMEFGPLPAFDEVGLVLVEREGTRHKLGSISILLAPPQ